MLNPPPQKKASQNKCQIPTSLHKKAEINHQLRCLHCYVHISGQWMQHTEAPVTVPHQKHNHSFTAMPRTRITNKNIQHFGEWIPFPPKLWTALNTQAKHRGADGIITWQTARIGCRTVTGTTDQNVCHLVFHQKYEGVFKRGKFINHEVTGRKKTTIFPMEVDLNKNNIKKSKSI